MIDITHDKKRVFIETYGCQMNIRDSEVVAGMLVKDGFTLTENEREADVVLFNTCSVRKHAEDKVWSEIGRLASYRVSELSGLTRTPAHPLTRKPILGIIGCMAQNYKDGIFKRAPYVDFVVGPSDIHKIPEIIKSLYAIRYTLYANKIWETQGSIRPDEIYRTGYHQDKNHSYVVISEGCSNFCSYCVVPNVRGNLRNRNYQNIIKEIEETVNAGITNITLLGQNVNAYNNGIDFVELLRKTHSIEGLESISFVTSHPKDTTEELFYAMQELDKVKKALHMPVQSGSNRILSLMERGYTVQDYSTLAARYRGIVSGGRLTTDIIVGFPTETEEDFEATFNLMKEVNFDAAYIFKYSPRPNTKAAKFPDDVPKDVKEKRHKILLDFVKNFSH